MGKPEGHRIELPLPGPIYEFSVGLRELRRQSGLTYEQLGRKAHYATSTMQAAAAGMRLPTLRVTLAYVSACGGSTAEWRQRWTDARRHLDRQPEDSRPPHGAAGPEHVSTPAEFTAALRNRWLASELAYSNLERASGGQLRKSTLSDMMTGRVIPTADTLVAFLHACPSRSAGTADDPRVWLDAADRARAAAGQHATAMPRIHVQDCDPYQMGVHRAHTTADGPALPTYVRRDADGKLRQALEEARKRNGFILLVGQPGAGKTRLAYEAARGALGDFGFSYPARAGDLDGGVPPRTIVWLDNLDQYLRGGLSKAMLQSLLQGPRPVIVLGTIWPAQHQRYMTLPRPGEQDGHQRERDALALARVIDVNADLSPDELARVSAAARHDPVLAAALNAADNGIFQTLAAGPHLVRRWEHAPDVYAETLITAAVALRHTGTREAMTRQLRVAAVARLSDSQRAQAPPDWFENALAYATAPVQGGVAALRLIRAARDGDLADGYCVADFLVLHQEQTGFCGRYLTAGRIGSPSVLVGRDSELALLHGLLKELNCGCGGALLIEGEPGIGKSALVRAALAAGPEPGVAAGHQVFWGNGDELGQELPLVPFLDALQVRAVSANARRQTIARVLRGDLATDRGADVPAILSEQLVALAVDECAARPAVIVIDDLHWADPASIRLWARLARTARQVPLLLIGVMRPTPHRDDLLALRRTVDENARIQLTELTAAATEDLVAALAGARPERDLLRLATGAAGNPLYITELLAALARSGGVTITAAGGAELAVSAVPGSLPAAIADRLGFVSSATRTVLRAAALLGVEFAVPDLTAVLGRPVADLVPAINEAVTTGVLTESPGGLAFRHPLIRAVLYGEVPGGVRAAWHWDAGRALAAAGAPADRVARQLLRATGVYGGTADGQASPAGTGTDVPASAAREDGGPGGRDQAAAGPEHLAAGAFVGAGAVGALSGAADSVVIGFDPGAIGPTSAMDGWALDWLTASADSLVGQAPGVAAELLTQAVTGLPSRSPRHGWLASRLADALYRTGDRVAGERVAEQALAYAADPDLVVDLHWTLAQCRLLGGSSTESFTTLDRALASPGLSAKHRARLLVLAARTYLHLGDIDAAGREADGALASAAEAGDTWATGWALHVLALRALIRGELTDALPLYNRGLAVTEQDPALTDLGLLLQVNKAVVLANLNRYGEALATAERARQLADQVGTAIRLAQAHGVLGQLFFETGRWDDALTEIASVPTDLKESGAACDELGISAVISFHRNESAAARTHLAATEPLAVRIGQRTIPPLILARSLDREQAGDVPGALAVLTAAFDGTLNGLGEIEDLLGDAVRLAVTAGDRAAAQALTRQAATLAKDSQIPNRQANALYCKGMLDRDAAALLDAAQRYADAGRPLPRARALEAAAECFVEADDMARGRDAFTQAVAVYEALRAEADVNRVLAGFRSYGVRRGPHGKHRKAQSGWDSLTDTELKVAAFVEEGLSNSEIAARLMLSRRTVATHVLHILKKLNVTTRTDIARESALRALASVASGSG
jgi:DNA-binding CsgD family transcriptional regulator/transcriptional regulator with XRE-family HTH domain